MLLGTALVPFLIPVAASPLRGEPFMLALIGFGRITLGRIEGNLLNFGSAAVLFMVGRVLARAEKDVAVDRWRTKTAGGEVILSPDCSSGARRPAILLGGA